jgi:pyruvate carboxylase
MYPGVFPKYAKAQQTYGAVYVLPTPAFLLTGRIVAHSENG